jgi:hypothetical protein
MAAGSAIPQHLLKPETLAGLANLDLVARAVVNGFLTGMHRCSSTGTFSRAPIAPISSVTSARPTRGW